jgi:uncharacterized protein YjbI with pentapeptide repeats
MSKRFIRAVINGVMLDDPRTIEKELASNQLDWLNNCEFEDATITVTNNTLIWENGTFYSGRWYYGIFKGGVFHGDFLNGILEGGTFKGKWFSGVNNTKKDMKNENLSGNTGMGKNSFNPQKRRTSFRAGQSHHHRPY